MIYVIKIKSTKTETLQKLRDLYAKIDTYMECYRQYIDHLKSVFPYVSEQSFNDRAINVE